MLKYFNFDDTKFLKIYWQVTSKKWIVKDLRLGNRKLSSDISNSLFSFQALKSYIFIFRDCIELSPSI
jgi:hypothetical protein